MDFFELKGLKLCKQNTFQTKQLIKNNKQPTTNKKNNKQLIKNNKQPTKWIFYLL